MEEKSEHWSKKITLKYRKTNQKQEDNLPLLITICSFPVCGYKSGASPMWHDRTFAYKVRDERPRSAYTRLQQLIFTAMDLFSNIPSEATDDLRAICEGSAPFNDDDYLDLTSYTEGNLPDYESMFIFDNASADTNAGAAGQTEEHFPDHDDSTISGNSSTSAAPYPAFCWLTLTCSSREILQQVFARLDAFEDKMDKFQESQLKVAEEMKREMAGLREAISTEGLLEISSKG